MNLFLHRHPSAPPKVKKYINRFEEIANEFQDGAQNFHQNSQNLNNQFKNLSHNFKHALVSRSTMSHRPPRTQFFNDISKSVNANTFITGHIAQPSVSKKGSYPKITQPKKCNPISKVLPARPVYGAHKYYDSNATREMKLEEEELMMEVRNYPQLEYEYRAFTDLKKVDPYFHIGGFPREVLLRSPDERIYTHVRSSTNSNSNCSNGDHNNYLEDPSSYYIENEENLYTENEDEYINTDTNENINNAKEIDNNINEHYNNNDLYERNQYENEGHTNGKSVNNRRVVLTR